MGFLIHSIMNVFVGGVFHVQDHDAALVRVSPSTGVIAAGASQWLRVELRTDRPETISETAL